MWVKDVGGVLRKLWFFFTPAFSFSFTFVSMAMLICGLIYFFFLSGLSFIFLTFVLFFILFLILGLGVRVEQLKKSLQPTFLV